jgi:hypothetical protein
MFFPFSLLVSKIPAKREISLQLATLRLARETSNMSPALLRKGMTKILQNCAFVSYASTFLHLQPRLTQFFAFFCNQTSSKDEFFPTEFFIDDQFFMEILIDSTF